MGLARKAGVRHHLDDPPAKWVATWAGHLGFGTAVGGVYGAGPQRAVTTRGQGAGYGLLVWAASYLGWLPALGVVEPVARRPLRQHTVLIASHLVWGAMAGWLTDFFQRRANHRRQGRSPGRGSR